MKLGPRDFASAKRHFERLAFIQPAHDDKPINDRPASTNGVPARCRCEGRHPQIDVGRQPSVERNLSATGCSAALKSGEIKIRKSYRLLELVNALAGHEHPGHVGFARDDCVGYRDVAVGSTQKADFACKSSSAVFSG